MMVISLHTNMEERDIRFNDNTSGVSSNFSRTKLYAILVESH